MMTIKCLSKVKYHAVEYSRLRNQVRHLTDADWQQLKLYRSLNDEERNHAGAEIHNCYIYQMTEDIIPSSRLQKFFNDTVKAHASLANQTLSYFHTGGLSGY